MSAEGCGGGGGGLGGRSRVSAEQLDTLLSFMEEHAEFAAGKQAVYSRFSASKLWRLLAARLNAAAPASAGAHKSPDKWCRYWADIKYKARKKSAAGAGNLPGELSSAEERLRRLLGGGGAGGGGGGGGARRASLSDEGAGEEDACSDASGGERLATEELLAEAAMRAALAAEKQAEAVTQGVELLRELVSLVRERAPPPVPPPHAAHAPHELPLPALHHHHRL